MSVDVTVQVARELQCQIKTGIGINFQKKQTELSIQTASSAICSHRASYLYFKTLYFVKKCHLKDHTVVDLFRNTSKKYKHRAAFIFEDEKWTYEMVDELSNKVANFFLSQGFSKGDELALLLDNCPEFACIWLGLAKIGCVTALINTNLKEDSLAHSLNCINVKALIFGRNYSDTVKTAIPYFNNKDTLGYFCFTPKGASMDEVVSFPAKSLNFLLDETPSTPPAKVKVGFNDRMMYIYTSGTTGLPKAAIIRHSRFLWIGAAAKCVSQIGDDEIFYNTLPMYHTAGGVLFVSVVFIMGGTMILRKKFSASNFWKEAAKHKATDGGIYQQDIAECHTNDSVRAWFKEHQDQFIVLPCPENSPDLSPINNLWNPLDRVVRVMDPHARNLVQQ
ncbi:long-chain fatty acid transport protein 4 [Trichonephila clavipes]|nr:long-chain fatty acid transport protein 4 [Trichonephila clavipes]